MALTKLLVPRKSDSTPWAGHFAKVVGAGDVAKAEATIRRALTDLEAAAAQPFVNDAQRVEIVAKVLELRRSLRLDDVHRVFGCP